LVNGAFSWRVGAAPLLHYNVAMAARGRRILTSWLAFAIVSSALPVVAAAGDKTIVLLEVEGEEAPRLRKSLERMVKSQHQIMPGATYREAARRLRAKKLTPNNVKKVCAYLKVDGVLDGTVMQDDEGYKFIVRLRSAANGVIEKRFPIRLVEPTLREPVADKLAARLLPAIESLPSVDKEGEDSTRVVAARSKKGKEPDVVDEAEISELTGTAPKPSKTGKRARASDADEEDDDDADRGQRRRAAARDDGDESGDDGEGDGGDESDEGDESGDSGDAGDDELDGELEGEASLAAGQSTPRTTGLLVNAGVSFVGRKLSFSYSGAEGEGPPGFSGTPVPGAYVVGEIYPAAFGGGPRGALADLGVGFIVDRVIKLNAAVDDGTGMGTVALDTRMWRYGANLRYRHNFDQAEDGYSVQASLGFNTAGFAIKKTDAPAGVNVDVPNVAYKYLDLGVGGRVPILKKLSFLVEAKFLAPLTTGQIQTNSHYGPATVKGFDGEAALEYRITGNFMARAGARLMLVSFSFDGDGALDDHDGNGENDVSGASDRYLGGFLTGGYWF
jgi:hypothetical protein